MNIVTPSGVLAIVVLWLLFSLSYGWERVDCGLGVERACLAIKNKYEPKP